MPDTSAPKLAASAWVERVGADWPTCPDCRCKYRPGTWCPYMEYHVGFENPRPVFPAMRRRRDNNA